MNKTILTILLMIGLVGGALANGIDFDGTDDYLDCADPVITEAYPHWMMATVMVNGATNTDVAYSISLSTTTAAYYVVRIKDITGNPSGTYIARNGGVAEINSATLSNGVHTLLGVSRSATDHELYIDGVSVGSSSTSVPFPNVNYSAIGVLCRSSACATDFHQGPVYGVAYGEATITDEIAKDLGAMRVSRALLMFTTKYGLKNLYEFTDQPSGTSGDGDTFVNLARPGTSNCTGVDGANNTGLTVVEDKGMPFI